MRPSNKSRSRNKPGSNGGQQQFSNNNQQRRNVGNNINRVFESAGPDGKVRGTPQQIIEKYNALARDAQLSGDRVASENYLQHAEHYSRLLGEAQRAQAEQRGPDRDDTRVDDQPELSGGQQPQPAMQQGNQGYQPRPQQQPQPEPRAAVSGLAMIEPEDVDDGSGPIETPEGRSQRRPVPAAEFEDEPARAEARQFEAAPASDGEATSAEASGAEAAGERPKRPRVRRRAKAETPEPAPAGE